GHEVILVSGPVALDTPGGAQTINVISADEMFTAVESQILGDVDAAIFCAAVADYRPVNAVDQKIKKGEANQMALTLEKTADILGSARNKMGYEGLLVGFAAETHELEKHARAKLTSKKCDLLVANQVGNPETGFDSDNNELQLFYSDGHTETLERQSKIALGEKLIEIIEKLGEAGA
ncbi:MAG: phosphopantothenoylcysteine decarboxylase, partial [Verrucomicrobia bacterium]|nr:phosphopantothenoylcysteine decarboxylase [Verrucomicrobiota bacterium]